MFTRTKLSIILSLIIVVGLMCFGVLHQSSRFTPTAGPLGSVAYPPTINGLSDQCGPYYDFSKTATNYGTIPFGYKNIIPTAGSNVPMVGYMSDAGYTKVGDGVYNPDFVGYSMEKILRIEWEGYTIVWYSKDIPSETFSYMKKEVVKENDAGAKLLMMPWFFKNGSVIPEGRDFAYSTWGISQSCLLYSHKTLGEFQEEAASHFMKRDENNPPAGKVDKNGVLESIYAVPVN